MMVFMGMVIVAVILLLVIFGISIYENRQFEVHTYYIKNKKIPPSMHGFRIAVISDLHNQQYGEGNCRLLEAIAEQRPDIVVCAGDILIGKPGADMTPAISFVEALCRNYPVYMAMGNHEYRLRRYPETYPKMWDTYYAATTKAGAVWLDNETVFFGRDKENPSFVLSRVPGEAVVALTGFTMDACYYKRLRYTPMAADYVKTQCRFEAKETFQILLAHNPDYFAQYAAYGADVVVSGHVHGGMIRLGRLGGVISPMLRLFPKYDRGAFYLGDSVLLLSAGLGNHTFKIRVNNKPELMMIELEKPAKEE